MTTRTVTALLAMMICVAAHASAQGARRDSLAEASIRALDNEERLAALNQDYAALERCLAIVEAVERTSAARSLLNSWR